MSKIKVITIYNRLIKGKLRILLNEFRRQESNGKGTKYCWDEYKGSNKIVYLSPNMSIITLNVRQ